MVMTLGQIAEIKDIKEERHKLAKMLKECRVCKSSCKQYMVKGLTRLFCQENGKELTILEEILR